MKRLIVTLIINENILLLKIIIDKHAHNCLKSGFHLCAQLDNALLIQQYLIIGL